MKHLKEIGCSSISWLSSSYSTDVGEGLIHDYYEPDNTTEFIELLRELYASTVKVLIIGHTSNLYFTPTCVIDTVVSTRRLIGYKLIDGSIVCEAGSIVKKIAHEMIQLGVIGFEGLVDLPGTIGAAVYGNSGCFNYFVSDLVESIQVLSINGEINEYSASQLGFSVRSSAMKRGEINGAIISVRLKVVYGDPVALKDKSDYFHKLRLETQPVLANNLDSVFINSQPTFCGRFLFFCSRIINLGIKDENTKRERRNRFILTVLFARNIIPYVYSFNRYIFADSSSHRLFYSFIRVRKVLYEFNGFEIKIVE